MILAVFAYLVAGLLWAAFYAIQCDIKQEPITYGAVLGEALAWPYRIYLRFRD